MTSSREGKAATHISTIGAQFKVKTNLMNKFFNSPVDALDLRLANAEDNLSSLPADPFTAQPIKQEEEDEVEFGEGTDCHPLDCSEVELLTPPGPILARTPLSPDIQRVTLEAGEPSPAWRLSPDPTSPKRGREEEEAAGSGSSTGWPGGKRPRTGGTDMLDRRISLAESGLGGGDPSQEAWWANFPGSSPQVSSPPVLLQAD